MNDTFAKSPLSGVSPEQLYGMAQQKAFDNEIIRAIEEKGRAAVDEALLLGLTAYSPKLAAQGLEVLKPQLTQEPSHVEELYLVRWGPTGDAIMWIGEPRWPVGEWPDLGQIKVEVPYELVKADDRKWLAPSENWDRRR